MLEVYFYFFYNGTCSDNESKDFFEIVFIISELDDCANNYY